MMCDVVVCLRQLSRSFADLAPRILQRIKQKFATVAAQTRRNKIQHAFKDIARCPSLSRRNHSKRLVSLATKSLADESRFCFVRVRVRVLVRACACVLRVSCVLCAPRGVCVVCVVMCVCVCVCQCVCHACYALWSQRPRRLIKNTKRSNHSTAKRRQKWSPSIHHAHRCSLAPLLPLALAQ